MSGRPSYLDLPEGELRRRADEAVASLADCRACPRDCGVDRLAGKWSACKTGRYAVVSSAFPHFGEEDCLRGWNGSGTIFFSHCNLRCQFCLHPETLIATEGGLRPIRELFEEAVKTTANSHVRRPREVLRVAIRDGSWARVSRVFRHSHSGELIRLKPFNCPPVFLTPNHRVFAVRKDAPDEVLQVPVGSLSKDHRLVVPKRGASTEVVILDLAEILEPEQATFQNVGRRIPSRELVQIFAHGGTSRQISQMTGYHPAYVRKLRGEWKRGVFPPPEGDRSACLGLVEERERIRFTTETRPGIPKRLTLDERLAWLFGIYCAEGHVHSYGNRPNSHSLVFSFGHAERDRAEDVQDLIGFLFGAPTTLRRRRTTFTVQSGRSSLAVFFKTLCGTGAASKRVPVPIRRSPLPVIEAFLRGVAAGDGWENSTHVVVNTISEEFALGMFELGILSGTLPSFHTWNPPPTKEIEGRTVNQRPLHYVKFPKGEGKGGSYRTGWRQTPDGVRVPIHTIERISYQGPVFNLEVDHPDHSYLAPFIAVANCQNSSISWEIPPDTDPGSKPEEIAAMALDLQRRGCHNLNFVTPEHVVPQVLEAVAVAVEKGLRIPIVYNTSAYDALESLRWMDGVVDIYMPDLKCLSPEYAKKYMKAEDYPEHAKAAMKEMHRQVGDLVLDDDGLAVRGVLVRHLVMPGGLEETRKVLEWIARELGPGTYLNLMDQYRPSGKVGPDHLPEINRGLDPGEFGEAVRMARDLGLRRLDERDPHPRMRRRLRILG